VIIEALRRAELAHRGWRYRRRVDPDEIHWMRGALREGDVVVDAGAYKGGYTYWMRRAVGPTGTVFAFEPQPEIASHLQDCVDAFGWANVSVVRAALSSEPGERTLLVPGGMPSPGASLHGASLPSGSTGYPVRLDTLDHFLDGHARGARVRLIKCDVEGHELDVFSGATGTLEAYRPLLLFECEARHDPTRSVQDVFDHLRALGYRGSFFLAGERIDVDQLDLSRHQVEGRRPYVNNFVFVPEGT
jgi:FkbM family methyltransferase